MSNFQGEACPAMNPTILSSPLMLVLVLPTELTEDQNTNIQQDAMQAAFYVPASPLSMTWSCIKVCKGT